MPTKARKDNPRFKKVDYDKVVALMIKKDSFSGKALTDIAKELDIPIPRVYNYRKRYLKGLGVDITRDSDSPGVKKTAAVILETNIVGRFDELSMKTVIEELEKLTHFKWDGMNFMLHCIKEFKVIVSDPNVKLEDKIKLFQLITPYIATRVPQNTESNGEGNTLTVANIYNQAQQFYQQQNFISNETAQDSNQRNKKK